MTIFWIYVVTQLVTTAYGITVINSVKKVPALKKRLASAGYTKQERDSLYKFSDFTKNFLLGFIPFYFAIKAVRLINDEDPVRVLMHEEIDKGNYITDEDRLLFREEEERAKNSIAYDPKQELYDTAETYHARKIDLNSIYNDEETPREYIEKEIENTNNSVQLTDFTSNNLVPIDELVDEGYKKDSVYEYNTPITVNVETPKVEVKEESKEEVKDESKEEVKEESKKEVKEEIPDINLPKDEWIYERASVLFDELLEKEKAEGKEENNNIDLWQQAQDQAEKEYDKYTNKERIVEVKVEEPKVEINEPKETWIENRTEEIFDKLLAEEAAEGKAENNNIDLWEKASDRAEKEYEKYTKKDEEQEKEELKENIIKNNVTNSDIAKAISELSEEELKELSNKLISLAEIKRNKELLLEKDVA